MKKNFFKILILSALVITITNCKDKAKEATTTEAEEVTAVKAEALKFTADIETSTIEWKGFKPTGTHNGTINLESGFLNMVDGKISSGTFLIDMNSIVDLDITVDKEG